MISLINYQIIKIEKYRVHYHLNLERERERERVCVGVCMNIKQHYNNRVLP